MTTDERTCLLLFLRSLSPAERPILEAVASAESPKDAFLALLAGDRVDVAELFYPAFRKGWMAAKADVG